MEKTQKKNKQKTPCKIKSRGLNCILTYYMSNKAYFKKHFNSNNYGTAKRLNWLSQSFNLCYYIQQQEKFGWQRYSKKWHYFVSLDKWCSDDTITTTKTVFFCKAKVGIFADVSPPVVLSHLACNYKNNKVNSGSKVLNLCFKHVVINSEFNWICMSAQTIRLPSTRFFLILYTRYWTI